MNQPDLNTEVVSSTSSLVAKDGHDFLFNSRIVEANQTRSHRRYNPLLGKWLIVSPHRTQRPWCGHKEQQQQSTGQNPSDQSPQSQPTSVNRLCPGAVRDSGQRNDDYSGVYIFENDFPALQISNLDSPIGCEESQFCEDEVYMHSELFRVRQAEGRCFVMCFHPNPDLHLATMSREEVSSVIGSWCELTNRLAGERRYRCIQIFENRGSAVGSSCSHPHCQIWASCFLPNDVRCIAGRLVDFQRTARLKSDPVDEGDLRLLLRYARDELTLHNSGSRLSRVLIHIPDQWLCMVPFWAQWPFETMIVCLRPGVGRLSELRSEERAGLVTVLQDLVKRYDCLFDCPFPYCMGWMQAPVVVDSDMQPLDTEDLEDDRLIAAAAPVWQLFAVFYPPLLRSASVRKFVAGYELLAECQRDITPERAAQMLRDVAEKCG